MPGFMETVLTKSRPAQAFFVSKVDDVKIKRNVSLFCLHAPIFLFLLLSLCVLFFFAWSEFK